MCYFQRLEATSCVSRLKNGQEQREFNLFTSISHCPLIELPIEFRMSFSFQSGSPMYRSL